MATLQPLSSPHWQDLDRNDVPFDESFPIEFLQKFLKPFNSNRSVEFRCCKNSPLLISLRFADADSFVVFGLMPKPKPAV